MADVPRLLGVFWPRAQSVVAQSSGEAELMSLSTGLAEGLSLVGLLSDCLLPGSMVLLRTAMLGGRCATERAWEG